MPQFTLSKMPRQDGRTAVVTGANSGVGYFTAQGLAERGVHVVMACRNLDKGASAKTQLEAEVPGGSFELMEIDTSSLESVRRFAAAFRQNHTRLDYLVNNAGIMAVPQDYTSDGFERQLATNYLGHFALTGLLLDQLEAAEAARVITLSSIAHKNGKIHFDDLQLKRGYSAWKSYGQTKLACLVFAYELDRRLRASGSSVESIGVHPGVSNTNLTGHFPWYYSIVAPLFSVMGHAPHEAAKPSLMAALHPNVHGGSYLGPEGFREMKGEPGEVPSTAAAKDLATGRRLWRESEALTGVTYLSEAVVV